MKHVYLNQMVKSIAAVGVILFTFFTGNAQDTTKVTHSVVANTEDTKAGKGEPIHTLFGVNNIGGTHITSVGGWGGATFGAQDMEGRAAWSYFIRGGVLLNHRFTIGGAMGNSLVLTTPNPNFSYTAANGVALTNKTQGIIYGGLLLQWTFMPMKVVNISIPLVIGAGGSFFSVRNNDHIDGQEFSRSWTSAAFAFRPGIDIDININEYMKIGIEAGYLFMPTAKVSAQDADGNVQQVLPASMGNAVMLGISIKAGKF